MTYFVTYRFYAIILLMNFYNLPIINNNYIAILSIDVYLAFCCALALPFPSVFLKKSLVPYRGIKIYR